MDASGIVIVGAGQSGLQLAGSLRDEGYAGRITLIGDEPTLPYQRPPLSKSYLSGDVAADDLVLEAADFFARTRIEWLQGERVVALNRQQRQIELLSGASFGYAHLVLATGSRNRLLPGLQAPLQGLHSLRSIVDAQNLKSELESARNVVVVGAGFLGLEVAAIAAVRGARVHVVEATGRTMERAISPVLSQLFRARHEAAGVQFSFDAMVIRLQEREGRVSAVQLADGRVLEADLVLVAIGVVPNAELAAEAGLEVRNGVVVDDCLTTQDPSISAIGDCAAFSQASLGFGLARLESVQNAVDQARYLAKRLATGIDGGAYEQVPIFWSEQCGLRLQIAGLATRDDQSVVRGDPATNQLSVLRYRDGQLVALESVNRPADHMAARKLLARRLSPTLEQAVDPGFDLRAFANTPPQLERA
ncbi:NAD(P)/FAD-dependent oxidoreductase [Hydrocarboniphaga effusa]|uniref:NAD(P)/FAD-dependent oxidoreductase n=1 Tax=Hydrocarboniphaga effusa TaxID=243629 RepID=UPI003BA91AEE